MYVYRQRPNHKRATSTRTKPPETKMVTNPGVKYEKSERSKNIHTKHLDQRQIYFVGTETHK